MKNILVLCKDREQCRYYMQDFLMSSALPKSWVVSDPPTDATNGDEHIWWRTPDDMHSMLGMRFDEIREQGTPYEHSKYYPVRRFLETRLNTSRS